MKPTENSNSELAGVAVDALVRLIELAYRHHYNCEEDTFYGCPKSTDGCSDDRQGEECNCGADEHNAEVERLSAILLPNAQDEGSAPPTNAATKKDHQNEN
jgi:hypothetical protein